MQRETAIVAQQLQFRCLRAWSEERAVDIAGAQSCDETSFIDNDAEFDRRDVRRAEVVRGVRFQHDAFAAAASDAIRPRAYRLGVEPGVVQPVRVEFAEKMLRQNANGQVREKRRVRLL